MDYGEGMKGSPKRQNHKQPSGGSRGKADGSFGRHKGSSKTDGGVTYDADAGDACSNNGNYNMVGSSAREFGTGGKMSY